MNKLLNKVCYVNENMNNNKGICAQLNHLCRLSFLISGIFKEIGYKLITDVHSELAS